MFNKAFLTIVVCVCFVASSQIAFGQFNNHTVAEDLNGAFKHFSLIKMSARDSAEQVNTSGRLQLRVNNQIFKLRLEPRNLLAANYRAAETTADGLREISARPAITTYQGTVDGAAESKARLTITDSTIEGFVFVGAERYYIEPARRYARTAAADDFVVYSAADLSDAAALSCGLEKKIEEAAREYAAPAPDSATMSFQTVEIATEADAAMVAANNGVSSTNQEILHILNMVEGRYEQELGITFSVTFQHGWATGDPYPATMNGSLTGFQSYWNSNFPVSQYPRDTAHLFTAKDGLQGQGLSYISVICAAPSHAYGVTGWINYEAAKFLLVSHELGHNFGAQHVDAAQNCGDTVMNAQLYGTTPLTFCQYSRDQMRNFINANSGCLSVETTSTATARFNFDGDNKTDISVFRPESSIWYVLRSSSNTMSATQFGTSGDRPMPEDFDGDKVADTAVYRSSNGVWYIIRSSDNTFSATQFGAAGDVADPADFTGDGKAEVAVFRPSNGVWYVYNLVTGSFSATQFGVAGDIPVASDFDGDNRADAAVYRPSNRTWYMMRSTAGFNSVQFGAAGDRVTPADFDGDAKTDVAVFRPANGVWYILQSSNGAMASKQFGQNGDVPTTGDYDGDGKSDIAVFRPASGSWYRLNSSNNVFSANQFGAASDLPIPAALIQ